MNEIFDAWSNYLEEFVRDRGCKTVLEIGTGNGYSSSQAFVRGGADLVVTIDELGCGESPNSKIIKVRGKAEKLATRIRMMYPEKFDLVFFDALHDYKSVKIYWTLYQKVFKDLVLFDDANMDGTAMLVAEIGDENVFTATRQPTKNNYHASLEGRFGVIERKK